MPAPHLHAATNYANEPEWDQANALCVRLSFTDADSDCLMETLTAAIDGTLRILFL